MTADPTSPYPFLEAAPPIVIFPAEQPVGPTAQQLADLANKMIDGANHWATLRDYDRCIQCHQAAALYASASMASYANGM